MVLRLGMGHYHLNANMNTYMHMLKLATTSLSVYGMIPQTPEHAQQTCPYFSSRRRGHHGKAIIQALRQPNRYDVIGLELRTSLVNSAYKKKRRSRSCRFTLFTFINVFMRPWSLFSSLVSWITRSFNLLPPVFANHFKFAELSKAFSVCLSLTGYILHYRVFIGIWSGFQHSPCLPVLSPGLDRLNL